MQVGTKFGELRFKHQFSKITQSWVERRIVSKKDKISLHHLMDEVLDLKLLREEYPIPAPKNVPKNITLVEKPENKSITMRTRFSA